MKGIFASHPRDYLSCFEKALEAYIWKMSDISSGEGWSIKEFANIAGISYMHALLIWELMTYKSR